MRNAKIKGGIPNKCTLSYSRSVSVLRFWRLSPNINFLPLAVTLLRSLRLLLAANAWLNIALFLADIADNAVFLAFAFKSFYSAFKIFVLTYNNC